MRIRNWVEAVNLSTTKRQFSHQLVLKLMAAFNRIHRDFEWSWSRRDFVFTTQAKLQSAQTWTGVAGHSYITVAAGAGDVTEDYTGCEIYITSTEGTTRSRVIRIGDRDDNTYVTNKIHLDQELRLSHTAATVSVFRREYSPRSGLGENFVPDAFNGDLRKRGESDRIRHVDNIEYFRNFTNENVTSTESTITHFAVTNNKKLPAPRFAPHVSGNNTNGTKTPPTTSGKVYLTSAYRDPKSNLIGPIGPIVVQEFVGGLAAGYSYEVEYGNESGVPEQSYELVLLSSPISPVGFDGAEPEDKDFRISEVLIPFSEVGVHPRDTTTHGAGAKGGGRFPDLKLDEDVFSGQRWFPWNDQVIIQFREIPTSAENYTIPGKVRHPWMNWIDDEPLVPDDMQDALEHAVRASNPGDAGIMADRRFLFAMKQLRAKDNKKSRSSSPRRERFGHQREYYDRYDLA